MTLEGRTGAVNRAVCLRPRGVTRKRQQKRHTVSSETRRTNEIAVFQRVRESPVPTKPYAPEPRSTARRCGGAVVRAGATMYTCEDGTTKAGHYSGQTQTTTTVRILSATDPSR